MAMGASTIYTNHPGGNLVHKHKTKQNWTWFANDPLQSISKPAEQTKKRRKFRHLKTQPSFSEAFITGWRKPFDFPTGISGFPMLMVTTPGH